MEAMVVSCILKDDEVEIVFTFNRLGDWVIYDTRDSDFREEGVGVAVLQSSATWLVLVTGWSLLIGIMVVLEVTCGNYTEVGLGLMKKENI